MCYRPIEKMPLVYHEVDFIILHCLFWGLVFKEYKCLMPTNNFILSEKYTYHANNQVNSESKGIQFLGQHNMGSCSLIYALNTVSCVASLNSMGVAKSGIQRYSIQSYSICRAP